MTENQIPASAGGRFMKIPKDSLTLKTNGRKK